MDEASVVEFTKYAAYKAWKLGDIVDSQATNLMKMVRNQQPQGLLEALNRMKAYGKPMYVTENEVTDAEDTLRSQYPVEHLKVLDRAINEEKINLQGYLHWSLTDNCEQARIYGMKFGLCHVNLETKKRTPRKSAETFRRIIKAGEVDTV